MNYHIMADDKFINDFIRDAEAVAPGNNTYIINTTKAKATFIKSDQVTYLPFYTPAFKALLKKISAQDRLFIHWASEEAIQAALSLPTNITIGMFFWGGDIVEIPAFRFKHSVYGPMSLRYFEQYEERPKLKLNPMRPKRALTSFAQRFFNYKAPDRKVARTRDLFFKRLNLFLHWNPIDFEWVQRHYTTHATYKYFFYDVNPHPGEDELAIMNAPKEEKVTTILLGNSDTSTNNHLEALHALARYKDEPIKLVIPLSYGYQQYGDVIEKEAIRLFGHEKVMALRTFLNREQYFKMLAQVDIAVMYHFRTQAAGNVIALLHRGKKVFIHSNSTLYQLLQQHHAAVFDAKAIDHLDFKDFSTLLDKNDVQENIRITEALFNKPKKFAVLAEVLG
ncbi:4-alpha-L-fucosyltransferase (glycosyl transferase family 56) [Chitinophaga polysaccharea]|uniref:4-alpha-L-fucosyltransferase (Glycosyl transferase family 56) n=1 Tax=Chitinophaga polysaccharea TaxID=1293035 RepID=A0A561PNE3_9BACT|nr:TDP-N-acetylfucosamine:lipid II N-acetylfucosaminyltransferase [Chitinophaga polysaccharea]TWF39637.1 4-alpha-L-fucosyltransferase (glycosyl transferase family 56) [Chitinophaga polysaccharea]